MNETVPYPENGFKALICTFANMFLQAMDMNRLPRRSRAVSSWSSSTTR